MNALSGGGLDLYIKEADRKRERYIQDLIRTEKVIHQDLSSIFSISDGDSIALIPEDQYINGITVDFTLTVNGKIRALIECKAGDIGVTDYVRGIGQVLQYEYFWEEDISKNLGYLNEFNTVLLFPSSVVKNSIFNIGRFKYPKSTILIEINEVNKVTRQITENELEKYGAAIDKDLVAISQYYIRDNRLFEIFMLLKYLNILKLQGVNKVDRKNLELGKLRQLRTPNNRNRRNAFISLSSLGLIDRNNLPTPSGVSLGSYEYSDFIYMIYESYLKSYVDLLVSFFEEDPNNLELNNQEICERLNSIYGNKDILFLTESKGRYLSSRLNILRDDYGCIDFAPRSKQRVINYNLSKLKKEFAIKEIHKFSKAQAYLDNFSLLNQ